MNAHVYTPEALRELIERFDNPMVVARGGLNVAVNEALVRIYGYSREELEQAAWSTTLVPEERARMGEASAQLRMQGLIRGRFSFPVVTRTRDGRSLRTQVQVQLFPAADGKEPYSLTNILVLGEQPREVEQFGLLVEIALSLTWERSQEGIRAATVRGFSRANFQACFCAQDGRPQQPLAAGQALPRPSFVEEALRDGHPVFGGLAANSTEIYLPIKSGASEPEILFVSGDAISAEHASVWNLFSRQVSSALSTAKLIHDLERRNLELRSMAEVARLSAQPEASLDELLARIALPVETDAAVLYLRYPDGSTRVETAFGLTDDERILLAEVPLVRPEAVEPANLFPATRGRFGSGASVALWQAGREIGTLITLRRRATPFDPPNLRLLTTLGDLLLTMLEQRKLRADAANQLEESQLLLELARLTAGTPELEALLKIACDALVRLLGMATCHIMLLDPRTQTLRGAAVNQGLVAEVERMELTLDGPGITARAARERRPVVVSDGPGSASQLHPEFRGAYGERASVAFPLIVRDELVGVISLSHASPTFEFSRAWLAFAEASVGQLGLSIANARLFASLRQSYEELEKTRAEKLKQERLAALGELSAVVAHEVRNPLGVIFNAVGSLRRLLQPGGDAKILIDMLAEESDRLNRMVGELLDFARPNAPAFEADDLEAVLQDALTVASAQAAPGCDFELSVDRSLRSVWMDRRMMRQALVNVLVNAFQAMPRGGTVRASALPELRGGRTWARIDLCDEGPGIAQDLLARIFEPFFTTKAQGTGLGLAVVRRIVEDHQGEVAVSSTVGSGTTFTFRLPIEPERGRSVA